jgi:FkbM family methyltransferase
VTHRPADLFASAVPYYARYRAGYPAGLFDLLAEHIAPARRGTALDVGCGAGQFTIPLARHVGAVTAIDPLPDMLDHGRAAAALAGVTNVDWRVGDSTGLAELGVDGALLATFAASFHWTDRPAVLRVLAGLLAPGAVVVVVTDGLADADQPDWDNAITDIRARHLGPHRLAGTGTHAPTRPGHADVLRSSPFSDLTTLTWSWCRELTVDEVVGLQFSYSFSTPDLLGDRAEAFEADVRAAVLALHPSGTVVEPLRADVVLARRPGES